MLSGIALQEWRQTPHAKPHRYSLVVKDELDEKEATRKLRESRGESTDSIDYPEETLMNMD